MARVAQAATDWPVARHSVFIERTLTRFYSGQQQNVKNLTLTQIVDLVKEQIEEMNDNSILMLKSLAEQRDPHAVQAIRKMIFDVISELGVTSKQCTDYDEMVLYVYSMLYGFKNVEMERLYEAAKANGIEEIYVNRRDDVRYVKRNQRKKHPNIFWDNPDDVAEILRRLTLHHTAGSAGKSNPVNRIQLADGTRLTFTAGDASDPSFNLRFDRSEFLDKEDFVPRVMTESVYQTIVALTVGKASYGIIGKGAIGKTALLRQMIYELLKIDSTLRIFAMEIVKELNLLAFLRSKSIDPDVVETVATPEKTLEDLFENMKQRAVDLIVQGEILSAREVSNLLTAFKGGHPMGPFTAHSTGKGLPRYLAELMAQEKRVELESTVSQITHVLDASVVMKEKVDGEPRKLVEIWQYPDYQEPKLLVEYNMDLHKYVFYPAEGDLLEKLETLSYSEKTRHLHRHLKKVGIISETSHV